MIQVEPIGAQNPKTDWLSAAQLAVSGLAIISFLGLALYQAGNGIVNLASQSSSGSDLLPAFTSAWSQVLMGALIIPSAALALMRLIRKPVSAWPAAVKRFLDKAGLWLILAWPLVLAAGYFASQLKGLSWLILPPLSLLATALPIFWLVTFARRGLDNTRPQRTWGILTSGMVISPLLAVVFEVIVMAGAFILWVIWLILHPQSVQDLQILIQNLKNAGNNLQTLQNILGPYLGKPGVIITLLVILAGFAPLIEELVKPIAVWFLLRRIQTPAEGFVAGIISGAGFALAESLGKVGSFTGSEWVGVVIARSGTDLLHIITTGLLGWALAAAWHENRFVRLGIIYLLAVTLHGTWNAISLWTGLDPFVHPVALGETPSLLGPVGLGTLAVVMLFILWVLNRRLRRANQPNKGNTDVNNLLPD